MNTAISKRIRFHELTHNGKHAGVWLDPADIIREMLVAAGAPPGVKYHINFIGDGRCFGDARNTTFIALRIVYMDGYSSTNNEAVWPLAILDTPEKRGALRTLTKPLRKAMKHVQDKGILLPDTYCQYFEAKSDVRMWTIMQRYFKHLKAKEDERRGKAKDDKQDQEGKEGKEGKEDQDDKEDQEDQEDQDDEGDDFEDPYGEDDCHGDNKAKAVWEMDDGDCSDTDYEDYACETPGCKCDANEEPIDLVPRDRRHVAIEFWFSADMKFLLMFLGM